MSESQQSVPWRPTLGFEMLERTPLCKQHTTNILIDPCYTTMGMATAPLKFPNIVTGFERNPAHATRAIIYTRYSPADWTEAKLKLFNYADTSFSEKFRNSMAGCMKEQDDRAMSAQRESGKKLGTRINEITQLRDEVREELERLLIEIDLMKGQSQGVQKAIDDIESALGIAEECLYQREKRKGIDLVHDIAEQSLLKEVDLYRNKQDQLRTLFSKIQDQQYTNRKIQHELETDIDSKNSAIGIDNVGHRLDNFSKEINFYDRVERYFLASSNTVVWAENSRRILERSRATRAKSAELRTTNGNLINQCLLDVWDAWSMTNNALARRVTETVQSKGQLQRQLQKVVHELFEQDRNIDEIRKSIDFKIRPLKVAHTRLEARQHRRSVEMCCDSAQDDIIKEVKDLEKSMNVLQKTLQSAEEYQQQYLKTRSKLESELQYKVLSLSIDRDKCMGLRYVFPITASLKY